MLAPACLPGGRIDAAHPVVVDWAQKRGIDPVALASPFGTHHRPSAAEIEAMYFVELDELARLSGAPLDRAEIEGVIVPLRDPPGEAASLRDRVVLEYLAARPFPRRPDGSLDERHVPEDSLGTGPDGEVDLDHPLTVAWLSRFFGRVPSAADIEQFVAGGAA